MRLDVLFGVIVLMESCGLYLKKCEQERKRLIKESVVESFFKKENDICNKINKCKRKIIVPKHDKSYEVPEYIQKMFRYND